MPKLIIIAIYFAAAAALFIWWLILKGKQDFIKSRERIVSIRECNCDRRAEILETAENEFDKRYGNIRPAQEESAEVQFLAAKYVVTDSDLLKYNSDTAIRNVARNRIAHVIANDLVRKFPDPIESIEGTKKTYEYRFKVAEDR